MQDALVAQINGGMVCHRAAVAHQDNIAGLRVSLNRVKARLTHIVEIEVFTVTPPIIGAGKIRHLNPRQMIGVAKQAVAIHHAVLKVTPEKRRHAAIAGNYAIVHQPPGERTGNLSGAVSLTEIGHPIGMAVHHRHDLPQRQRIQVIIGQNIEMVGRGTAINTRDILWAVSAGDNQTA